MIAPRVVSPDRVDPSAAGPDGAGPRTTEPGEFPMPAPRICPHCGAIAVGRCRACRTHRYGSEHQAERQRWSPLVATGNVPCARGDWCGEPHRIDPAQPWHLDHIDGERRPSCAHHNDQYTGQ